MEYPQLLLDTFSRLSTPDFALMFLVLAAALFYAIHFGGRRHLDREIHKLISLVLSLALALILVAASIGLGIF